LFVVVLAVIGGEAATRALKAGYFLQGYYLGKAKDKSFSGRDKKALDSIKKVNYFRPNLPGGRREKYVYFQCGNII